MVTTCCLIVLLRRFRYQGGYIPPLRCLALAVLMSRPWLMFHALCFRSLILTHYGKSHSFMNTACTHTCIAAPGVPVALHGHDSAFVYTCVTLPGSVTQY